MDGTLGINEEYIERIDISLDKFLKYTAHLIHELYENPKTTDFFRWEKYLMDVLIFLSENNLISFDEKNQIRLLSIEEAIFCVIERLIESWFLLSSGWHLENSSYWTSISFAVHIYRNLGEMLGKWTKDFSHLVVESEIKFLPDLREENIVTDFELEEETWRVVSILKNQNHLKDPEEATILDDFLNYLWRKNILSREELIEAIVSSNFEWDLQQIIQKKIINSWKIQDSNTLEEFKIYRQGLIQKQQSLTWKKIEEVAPSCSNDFEQPKENTFLQLLQEWVIIITFIDEVWYKLNNFDQNTLIELALEEGVIDDYEAEFLETTESSFPENIIYYIFEKLIKNKYLEEIWREELTESFEETYQNLLSDGWDTNE